MFTLDEYDDYFKNLQEGYTIQEVDAVDGVRMFEVVKDEKTPEQLARGEILVLKQYLADTDYIANKLIEAIDDAELQDLKEKYAETLKKRRQARTRINELEK